MSTVDLTHPSESYIHMSDHPSVFDDSEYTDSSFIDTSRILRRAHEVDEARAVEPHANLMSMHSTPLLHRLNVVGDRAPPLLDELSQDSSSATLKGELEHEPISKTTVPLIATDCRTFTAEEITMMFAPILGQREIASAISKYSTSPRLQSPLTQKSQQLVLETIITPPDSHDQEKKEPTSEGERTTTSCDTALMDEIQHLKGHNKILLNHIRDMREQIQGLEVDLVRARNQAGIRDIEPALSIDEFEMEREDTQRQIHIKDETITALHSQIASLKQHLETISSTKQELSNENNYMAKNHVGDLDSIITRNKISPPFQIYYDKLQLEKYNDLTKAQLVNLIKNILLTLPISDFDHLSCNVELYGKYIKLSTSFLDELHSKLFANQTKPTYYLKEARNIDQLRKCLECVLGEIATK